MCKFNKEEFDKFNFQYPDDKTFNDFKFTVSKISLTGEVSYDNDLKSVIVGAVEVTDGRTLDLIPLFWSKVTGNCGDSHFSLKRM